MCEKEMNDFLNKCRIESTIRILIKVKQTLKFMQMYILQVTNTPFSIYHDKNTISH
jgi:hypothetical protein